MSLRTLSYRYGEPYLVRPTSFDLKPEQINIPLVRYSYEELRFSQEMQATESHQRYKWASICSESPPAVIIVHSIPKPKTWYIHMALLRVHWPLLYAEVSKSSNNTIYLGNVDMDAIELLIHWLHTSNDMGALGEIQDLTCSILIKAYFLGETYQIHRFSARVLESLTLKNIIILTLTPAEVRYAFEHSAAGSPLRAKIIELVTTAVQRGTIYLSPTPNLNTLSPFPDPSSAAEWSALFQKGGDFVTSVLQRLGQGPVPKPFGSFSTVPFSETTGSSGAFGNYVSSPFSRTSGSFGAFGNLASVPYLGSFGPLGGFSDFGALPRNFSGGSDPEAETQRRKREWPPRPSVVEEPETSPQGSNRHA